MERKIGKVVIMIAVLLMSIAFMANLPIVKASGTTIYIRADGSIDPSDAPISTVDNITYTLTGDYITVDTDGIVIERDNIVIDGAGYTMQGTGNGNGITLSGRTNITIENTNTKNYVNGIILWYSSNYNSISGNNIINNSEWGYGIYLIDSSSNSISGNNITANNGFGIMLCSSSSGNNISGNNITANYYDGIWLCESSNYNSIYENNITNNRYGINLGGSCSGNSISGNNITANNVEGIGLWDSSNYNSIYGNNITANGGDGILLVSISGNSISGNNITANNGYGIWLDSASGNSIFHNNFINNAQQVNFSDSANIWDDGYPSGGNYWSDYTGIDVKKGPNQDEPGSDDLGDIPYILDENNQDHYPLMNPYNSPPLLTYSLTITTTAYGTTDPATGTYVYFQGQSVQVQAIPDTGYGLGHWELDGLNVGSTNPYTVLIDNDHTLHAVFIQINYTLTITTTAGGTTDPVPGTYTYTAGASVQVTAVPDANYTFDHWELDGANVGSANSYPVLMNNNHTLHAVFGIHNVAITNVTPFKTVVGQGYIVNINVTAANQGDYPETFSVTAYYCNGTLTPEQWNVFWSFGDATIDGYINMADIDFMIANFNWQGPPGGNPADVTGTTPGVPDGKVNMRDIQWCIMHQGWEIWKHFLPTIDTQTIVDLTSGDSIALMFTWNTTGLTYGNYTITAVATPVTNETYTADNNCTIWVTITIPGDIKGDR